MNLAYRTLGLRTIKVHPESPYWGIGVITAVGLGIACHSPPDQLGVAHIALQPLVLLGLPYLYSQAHTLPCWIVRLWHIGASLDFLAGIVLHFGLQSCWLVRWRDPLPDPLPYLKTFAATADLNWIDKSALHLVFLSETTSPVLVGSLLLGGFLTAALLFDKKSSGHRQAPFWRAPHAAGR